MNGNIRLLIWPLVIIAIVAMMMNTANRYRKREVEEIPYNLFLDFLEKGEVAKLEFGKDLQKITVEMRNGTQRTTYGPPADMEWLIHLRQDKKIPAVEISFQKPGMGEMWVNLAATLLVPLVIMGFIYLFIVRQTNIGNNQALSFGRSRAKRLTDGMPTKTFADVAGVDEAKQELEEVVDFLKNAEKYKALGAEIPKGVLLMGPPGCGKTLLARAVAGEAHVPFFHISGSDFVEMFVGVGASRVRDLFEQAKASRPCIVFIDELDAVGRHRGAGLGGGHDEREQTLNQLLVEMDGFEVNAGVIIMAATNRPDVLDPALLRPGRFDRRVVVDNPDYGGRLEILELYIKSKPLEDNVDAAVLARQTAGFSGADLSNLVNEAALLAARKGCTRIAMEHFDEAIERVIAGPERKSRIISDAEKKVLAYHEAGHAVVSRALPEADPVRKVTILPRGFALGYTLHLPAEDRFIRTRSHLMAEMTALLGGRVAEELVFNEISTGAQNDLERVTEIARSMVCEFGMTEELGPRTLGRKQGPVFLGRDLVEDRNYSEEVAYLIDKEIRRLVDECYDRAYDILKARRAALDHVVDALLKRETLDGAELDRLIQESMEGPAAVAAAL